MFEQRSSGHELKQGFYDYIVLELNRTPRTGEVYLTNLATLERFVCKPIEDVTADDLRTFKRSHYSQAYKQSVIVAARQFHAWGALEGLWERTSIMDVATPRNPREPKAPISFDTARLLMDSVRTPLELRATYLGLYAGLRVHESALIDSDRWTGNCLTFIGKGGRKRSVPVHKELSSRRAEILCVTPASKNVLIDAFTRLRDRVMARDLDRKLVSTHSLRRTFATAVYDAGAPWEVVQKLLGHGGDVTALYARISWERLVEGIGGIDYNSGQPEQLSLFRNIG